MYIDTRIDETLINNLELYFPFLVRDAVKYIQHDSTLLEIILDDGRRVLYDDIEHAMRNLPKDSSDMTEQQCRNEFSLRLYRIMRRKCISQIELSERTGISQVQISKYLRGKATPSIYNADKIAKALGCSIEEFRYV